MKHSVHLQAVLLTIGFVTAILYHCIFNAAVSRVDGFRGHTSFTVGGAVGLSV